MFGTGGRGGRRYARTLRRAISRTISRIHARYPVNGYARVEAVWSSSWMDRGPVLLVKICGPK